MHACASPCSDPRSTRELVARSCASASYALAIERAGEAVDRIDAMLLGPDQIIAMAGFLARKQADKEDLPCSEMEGLLRQQLESEDLPLITACLQVEGCSGAWCELSRRLTEVVLHMSLPPSVVREEVLDESFLRLRRNVLRNFENRKPLDAFLAGVARNVVREFQAPRLCQEFLSEVPWPGTDPLEQCTEAEVARMLWRAVEELPGRERRVLELRQSGASFVEISHILDLPSRKTAARLSKIALARLRAWLRHLLE